MDLKAYFSQQQGSGILATSDATGNVDVAVYARPHVMTDSTVAFIMRDRLSHHNLQSNPQAAYIFREEGTEHLGRRLFLTRTHEDSNPELIAALRRRSKPDSQPDEERFLVTFHVDRVLPVMGTVGEA